MLWKGPEPSSPTSQDSLGSCLRLSRATGHSWAGHRAEGQGTEQTCRRTEAARFSATPWWAVGSPQHDRPTGCAGPDGRPPPQAGSGPDAACRTSTHSHGSSLPLRPPHPACGRDLSTSLRAPSSPASCSFLNNPFVLVRTPINYLGQSPLASLAFSPPLALDL